MNKAVIGFGSNIDPEKNIAKARHLITNAFTILGESEFVRTKPVGFTEQDDFINGSMHIETELKFEQLKQTLKEIEGRLGRKVSSIKFGPRTIDLDIVIFNGKVVDQDFYERDFLKNSVLELIPDLKYEKTC